MTFLQTLSALSPLQILNAALCAVVVVAVLCAVARMNSTDEYGVRQRTEPPIVMAFVTLGSGTVGWLVAYWKPGEWQVANDTLLIGGVAALVLATRRHTKWVPPRWMGPISMGVSMLTWAGFLWGIS